MQIVTHRQPCSTIVLGEDASWMERHAAEELQRYLKAMSRAEIPIADTVPADGVLIAVGNPDRNRLVGRAVDIGAITLSGDSPGLDGFVLKTVAADGREMLVVAGSTDRGTLYAVYWLLEEVLGIGFFRDGERVPDMPTIELSALSIAERPFFADRHDGNGCVFTYSASGWGFEEWKRELDWKAKRRVNSIWPFNIADHITPSILADWGVGEPPQRKPSGRSIHEQAYDYARNLGIRVPAIIPTMPASDALFNQFPDARTLLLQYSELPPNRIVHPADPLFRRFVVEFVKRYLAEFGGDHLYIANFISESRVLEGAANIHEARLDFVRAISAALEEADDQAIWVHETWSFDMDAEDPNHRWLPEQIQEYLDTTTVRHIVWDLWSEERGKYAATENFFSHPWAFGVLHSFGAHSFLHGDMPELLKRLHDVLNSPNAGNCVMFISQSEIIHFNSFYYEFCAELSWRPQEVTLQGFVERYCAKRYGAEVGKRLREAWDLLVETVHGSESGSVGTITDPLYWYRPDLHLLLGWTRPDEKTAALRSRRAVIIPKLRRAVGVFLAQADALKANEMAVRDLVDITRQWVAERFNIALLAARDAFLAGDSLAFDRAAQVCLGLLDDQIRLLASWAPYRLDTKVREHVPIYGDDAERWVKHTHVWVYAEDGVHSPPLRDYYRMDLDGLLAGYYKPRMIAYFDLLERKLAAGETSVADDEWESAFAPIEQAFIAKPMPILPTGENPVDIAWEYLARS
jgi:hypothetical protein